MSYDGGVDRRRISGAGKIKMSCRLGFCTFSLIKLLIFASLAQESVNLIYWWSLFAKIGMKKTWFRLITLRSLSLAEKMYVDTPCFSGCKRGQRCRWWWRRRRDPIVSKLSFGWNRLLVRVLHAPAEKCHHDRKGETRTDSERSENRRNSVKAVRQMWHEAFYMVEDGARCAPSFPRVMRCVFLHPLPCKTLHVTTSLRSS